MWQGILNTIDQIESWLVLLPLWVQIPILLVVLTPVCWWMAKLIDRVVEFFLRTHKDAD